MHKVYTPTFDKNYTHLAPVLEFVAYSYVTVHMLCTGLLRHAVVPCAEQKHIRKGEFMMAGKHTSTGVQPKCKLLYVAIWLESGTDICGAACHLKTQF